MSQMNKFSSHHPTIPDDESKEPELAEDNTLREAEGMLASPPPEIQTNPQITPGDIDKMVNSQSLSVVFQDLKDSEIAKFNKKSLDTVAEVQWNDNKGPLSSRREASLKVPSKDVAENSYNNSYMNKLLEDRSHTEADGTIKAKPVTPNKNSSLSNDIEMKFKPQKSKNNSVASYSDRSHMKFASPKDGQPGEVLDKSGVKKDKLFTEEDPEINSKEYRMGDGTDNKNEWRYNATKPGVDRSEFYNPNIEEDVHNQSVSNPTNLEEMQKVPSEMRITEDKLQSTGLDKTQAITQIGTFHKKITNPSPGNRENYQRADGNVQAYSNKKLTTSGENDMQVTQPHRTQQRTYGEEVEEDSNEDINHAE